MSFLSSPAKEAAPALDIESTARKAPVATELVRVLSSLGVERSFGVIGGAISAFCHALASSSIAYHHVRHESGAAFAALEASLATDKPTVVFTTTGPGLSNALTGLLAAHCDGGHVIVVSASTSAAHRGRLATQETSALASPSSMFQPGVPFHYVAVIEHPAQLASVAMELAKGCRRKQGFVAHISIPISVGRELTGRTASLLGPELSDCAPSSAAVSRAVQSLSSGRFVLWLGFGARHAQREILELAELTRAPVMCSPRAKGIFPEDHPQYLGVTGAGGHPEIEDALRATPPDRILVLGTRMGESSSFWSEALTPRMGFVHVDINPEAFGKAYPEVPCQPVVADIGAFARALTSAWPKGRAQPTELRARSTRHVSAARATGPVRPSVLMDAVQRVVVENSDAWVMAESGNSLCWAAHCLRFQQAGRYRGSTGFAAMGHAATGVVGAALARKSKAIAIVGDGAMLMNHEISSAVQYGAPAVWIVLNDGGYLMCEQGMAMIGWEPFGTRIPPTDFALMARALGASSVNVTHEASLDEALQLALACDGPFVVDVQIDRSEPAPSGRRTKSIMQQGFDSDKAEKVS
jgi:acetolactate synthase-1/2/3 large subunit